MLNRIPVCRELEEFKERVRLGDIRGRYGNRLCFYPPRQDTFFSCLSYAQCGSDRLRVKLRGTLLQSFVERVTGEECPDVPGWRKSVDQTTLVISERCVRDPAVRSLAVTSGGSAVEEDLLRHWITSSQSFRVAVLRFIDINSEVGSLYCRFVFAYIYCSLYDSDVVFYGLQDSEVVITHEISKIDGRATSVLHDRTYADPRHRPPAPTPRSESCTSSSGSVSDSDAANWHITYLLYIEAPGDGGDLGRFELMYTPNVGAEEQQMRRQQRYQLRLCYVDGNRGKVNCEPRMGHPAVFCAPPKRFKVHSYLLSPEELYPERIYQVNSADARGLTPDRLPVDKSMYVYLYYKDVGGHPMAVFVKAVDGGPAPQGPMFTIQTERAGRTADGVLVAVAKSPRHAHRHVELEAHAEVVTAEV
jgi:hypothetical protein